MQKEGQIWVVTLLGSVSGSQLAKISFRNSPPIHATRHRRVYSFYSLAMTTECITVPSLVEKLTEIRKYSSENVVEHISTLDLLSRLPTDFLNSLDDKDRVICFRASLLCYCVTNGAQIPREMQLRAVLADQHEKDYLVAAGTGSGKTLPMALNILLEDMTKNWITLTISPLKRLQSTQETDFNTRYGIPTVVINEVTP